jgi:hypothetical protein
MGDFKIYFEGMVYHTACNGTARATRKKPADELESFRLMDLRTGLSKMAFCRE